MLVDARGAPLSLIVTGAHRHDVGWLEALLPLPQPDPFLYAARKYDGHRPRPRFRAPSNLD